MKRIDPTKNVLQLVEAAVERIDDLREAESRRINEILGIQMAHIERLMLAESKRLDAIREIDTNTLSVANERVAEQAEVLARQLSITTENIRESTKQITDQLESRIKVLEESRFKTHGTATGRKELWVLISGVVMFVLGIAGIVWGMVG